MDRNNSRRRTDTASDPRYGIFVTAIDKRMVLSWMESVRVLHSTLLTLVIHFPAMSCGVIYNAFQGTSNYYNILDRVENKYKGY